MKFISAGHCDQRGPNYDPGAIGVNGVTESSQAVRIRNRVIAILNERGHRDIVRDADGESLAQYLRRIQPGSASVTVEFHFDAFRDPKRPLYRASGTTALVAANPLLQSRQFGAELARFTASTLQIPLRDGGDGDAIMTEADSHRGRLGLMREAGIVCLLEVGFIDNPSDMQKFNDNFETLCQGYATIIQNFDDLIK